jgi:hypothetical protein
MQLFAKCRGMGLPDYENGLFSFSSLLSGLDFKSVDWNEAILPFFWQN